MFTAFRFAGTSGVVYGILHVLVVKIHGAVSTSAILVQNYFDITQSFCHRSIDLGSSLACKMKWELSASELSFLPRSSLFTSCVVVSDQ